MLTGSRVMFGVVPSWFLCDLGVILRDHFSSLSRPSRKAIMISRKKMDTAIKFGFVKHQIHLEFQNFYTLTKIHKATPVGRPIVWGCDGPTEKLSSFVDKRLQPIVQQQKTYLKDITDFINYRENTKVPEDVIFVSMNVQIYFKRREYTRYAEHTKHST